MKIIPVIDLKNGLVVHAQQGQRDRYQAINTALCASPEFNDVLRAFLAIYAFDTFYIADLNAITGEGDNAELISEGIKEFPQLNFWVDAGFRTADRHANLPLNYLPVLGSESYSKTQLTELKKFNKRFILSLDYALTQALGPAELFANDQLWPAQIIIMSLAQVGSNQGPDLQKLTGFCQQYPHKNFIGAGGIRHKQDLITLSQLGIKQVLVASALHSGQISTEDIADLQAKKYPS